MCVCASVAWGQPVVPLAKFSSVLQAKIQASHLIQQNPAWGRLMYMRFYFPHNTIYEEPGFWQRLFSPSAEEQERAVAFYLFNMYVSASAYGEYAPAQLTLEYLGALDRLSLIHSFDVRNAEKFYLQHKDSIKKYLQEMFASHPFFPIYHGKNEANDARELAFMRLLSKAPLLGGKPSYRLPANNRLHASASDRDVKFVKDMLRRAIFNGKGKVITYQTPQMRPEDVDNGGLTPRTSRILKTYRYAIEECAYCSYLFGKQVCEMVSVPSTKWGALRVYKIIAKSENEEFLKSSSPDGNFTQADGTPALKWRYHTASLVILNQNGQYAPLVADRFLAGETPVLLTDWLKKFSDRTIFFAVPFVREAEMEKAFKHPERKVGDKVMVDGVLFEPHPVIP